VKEVSERAFSFIEAKDKLSLMREIEKNPAVSIVDIVDHRGYTLLHMAAFKNLEEIGMKLMQRATETVTEKQIHQWVNHKTDEDGFAALHFASFRGNINLIQLFIKNGANIHQQNNFGINVMHVAAQGDQPISLFFFKEKGVDIRSRDHRQSTHLHWACYSKSEIALCYLLSWVHDLEDKDIEGYTPLHLAVKSVEQIRNTRPVRTLLVRGSSRESVDKSGKKPVDLVD